MSERFWFRPPNVRPMDTVRKGLRDGDITKDTYGRYQCATDGVVLKKQNDPDGMGSIRTCPDCGRRWRRLE